jgi:inhibitor of KinA sporulation pathway (predicted exonuclease)
MKRWVDVRTLYSRAYGKGKRTNLTGMLLGLGFKFEGRPHSGIADAKNIARVFVQYLDDGHVVSRTDRD